MTDNKENNVTRRIAGIHFSKASKLEFYLAEDVELSLHDMVVVKGEHGNFLGRVIVPPRDVPTTAVATNIKNILRKANKEDIDQHDRDLEKAREHMGLCAKKVQERALPMKLIDVAIEENKIVFFFFAEERIDFRALVKDLASALHMRIEMRQIGARDEAKAIGALGPCGLACCCEKFLTEFKPISIAMAKTQGLSPNPAKLTGMCGKLKCCLNYENEIYIDERKLLPPVGARVKTPEGTGVITNLDVLKHVCSVRLDDPENDKELRCECSKCELLSKPTKAVEKEETDKEYEKFEG